MLGPFRVRNLRRQPSPPGTQPYAFPARRRSSLGAVVSISGQEYDSAVLAHPEARLRYLDDDDGEVVTVGTQAELAERLDEPIPRSRKPPRPVVRLAETGFSDHPSVISRPVTPDMHVFEIDRQGASTEIWEEIERKTRELQQSDVLPAPQSEPDTTQSPPTTQKKLPYNDQALYNSEDTISNSGQVDISDDVSRLNYVMEERVADERHKAASERRSEGERLHSRPEDMRNFYFEATSSPRLLEDTPESSKPARHATTMRLSDVLNDVEPETLAKETTPLLESFHEDYLTAEGKRQANEAGRQLRMQGAARARAKEFRHQLRVSTVPRPDLANRWASYSNTNAYPALVEKESKPVLPVEKKPEIVSDEGGSEKSSSSLLDMFRTELDKITKRVDGTSSKQDISDASKPASPALPTNDPIIQKPQQKLPQSSAIDRKDPYDITVQKLILQTVMSISSNINTLNDQIKHNVLPTMPLDSAASLNDKRGIDCSRATRAANVFHDFDERVKMATNMLQDDSSTEETGGKVTIRTNKQTLERAIGCLNLLDDGLQALGRGLISNCPLERTIPPAKDYNGSTYTPAWEEFSTKPTSPIQPTFYEPIVPARIRKVEPTEYPEVNEEKFAPKVLEGRGLRHTRSVRFEDSPTTSNSKGESWHRQESSHQRNEPQISYRHVPSPMPLESMWQRGRQPAKATDRYSPVELPYNYIGPPPSSHALYKRRSLPMLDSRRRSRSRSRSPAKPIQGGSLAHASPPPPPPRPNPVQSSVNSPVRQPRQPEIAPSLRWAPGIRSVGFENGPKINSRFPTLPDFEASTQTHQRESEPTAPTTNSARGSEKHRQPQGLRRVRTQIHKETPNAPTSFGWQQGAAVAGPSLRHAKSTSSIRRIPIDIPVTSGSDAPNQPADWTRHAVSGDALPTFLATTTVKLDTSKPVEDFLAMKGPPIYTSYGSSKRRAQPPVPVKPSNWSNAPMASSPLLSSRFPTLEQFESRDNTTVPTFPPLPSMEPLVPLRPFATKADTKEPEAKIEENPAEKEKIDDIFTIKRYPGAWPEETESSGEFFRRVTGLGEADSKPVSPISPTLPDLAEPVTLPGARLMKPFDPIAETETIDSIPPFIGVRRSATVSHLNDRFTSGERRPYSAYFDGSGRVEWDSFLHGPDRGSAAVAREMTAGEILNTPPKRQPRTVEMGESSSSRATAKEGTDHSRLQHAKFMTINRVGEGFIPQTQELKLTEQQRRRRGDDRQSFRRRLAEQRDALRASMPPPPPPPVRRPEVIPMHNDSTTVSSIQTCVDHLKDLGFGMETEGGVSRLVVYAQAANGDLGEAIDIINEERKAYNIDN